MKRRWTWLFGAALATLAGFSWLASAVGMSFLGIMNIGLTGMIAAAVIAFVAMIKETQQRWPAIVALVCTVPLLIESVPLLPDVAHFTTYFGPSIVVIVVGVFATAICAIRVLTWTPPLVPPEPPIAPARVV
jgi:hypothetical protein